MPLNPIDIPHNFKSLNDERLMNIINNIINNKFIYSEDLIYYISDLSDGNSNKLYYILYEIMKNNSPIINLEKTPKSGINFRDRKNDLSSLGIYHCHIDEIMVLIWYIVKLPSDNEMEIKFKYLKHPSSYNSILRDIFNEKNTYNIETDEYLKDLLPRTYLKENKYVKSFIEFIKSL